MFKKNATPLSLAREVIFLFSVGPFFLLITLFLLSLRPGHPNFIFAPVMLLGFFFSIRWKIKGFCLSLLFLIPVFLLHESIGLEKKWILALAMSFALSFLLLALGTAEGLEKIGFLAEKEQKNAFDKKQAEEMFRYREKIIIDKLSTAIAHCDEAKKQEELSKAQHQFTVEEFKKEHERLSAKLSEVELIQHEIVHYKNENARLLGQLSEERSRGTPISVENAQDQEIADLYKQLRVQFAEKNDLLHEARKELYQKETELAFLKKEAEEMRIGFDTQELKKWGQAVKREENLKEEIASLEELVSHLSIL